MGIYDRAYYRQERQPSLSNPASWSVVGVIIAVNVAVWVADAMTQPTTAWGGEIVGRWLSDHLAVHVYTLTSPWLWWQYLTAAFAHSPLTFGHIFGNMLVLFFLGREVEYRYGPKEFLRVYLVTAVFASFAWNVANKLAGTPPQSAMYGASGAIAGVVVLYALNFPHRTILLFFVLPMPAWMFGALVVILDVFGAIGGPGGSNIAYSAHLAGAAFALVYYWRQWNFAQLTEGLFSWMRAPTFRTKPRLRVLRPEADQDPAVDSDLAKEVDRILEKISSQGEAGLTAKERHTLEKASREYQRKMGRGSDDKGLRR